MSDLYDHVLSKPELRQSKPSRADFAVQARNPVTVVLDGVRGYYNIGAIFRLCDAFLVERLIICGEESQGEPLLRRRSSCRRPWVRSAGPVAGGTRPGSGRTCSESEGYWIAVVELTAESVSIAAMRRAIRRPPSSATSGLASRRTC